MSPIEAKVFIIEDDDVYRETLQVWLERFGGHSVVGTAGTFQEAHDAAKGLTELGTEIVTLDGNLTPGETNGREGEVLAQEIRRKAPSVTIVGLSLRKGGVKGVHVDIGKSAGLPEVNRVITELPRTK